MLTFFLGMKDKYVYINIPDDTSESVFVTYHKDKIHIVYNGELTPNKLKEISKSAEYLGMILLLEIHI